MNRRVLRLFGPGSRVVEFTPQDFVFLPNLKQYRAAIDGFKSQLGVNRTLGCERRTGDNADKVSSLRVADQQNGSSGWEALRINPVERATLIFTYVR
jgi:hypothetical protein